MRKCLCWSFLLASVLPLLQADGFGEVEYEELDTSHLLADKDFFPPETPAGGVHMQGRSLLREELGTDPNLSQQNSSSSSSETQSSSSSRVEKGDFPDTPSGQGLNSDDFIPQPRTKSKTQSPTPNTDKTWFPPEQQ